MKELEHPYKSEYVISKKKQIKRLLLEEKNNFTNIKIAILAGSIVNEVKDCLDLFLLNNGIKADFYMSEYNRFYEDAVFENSELEEFAPDIVYIFTSFRNISNDVDMSMNEEEINHRLILEYDKYKNIWQNISDKYKSIIIQNNFEYPNFRLLGNKDISDSHGFSNYLMRLNEKFYEYARNNSNFYICDLNYIAANFGLNKWHSEKLYALYKIPCDVMAMPDIAFNVANIIKSIYGKNKKALALDLDNTLWGGVISEDGIDGIKIGPETAEGEIYLSFQKYLKKIKDLGIILNVVSKNDESVALNGIDNTDGVLKQDDFVSIKANWDTKADNINTLSKELNLGADSFVFVDDNPMERDIVAKNVKGVGIIDESLPERYINTIDKSGYFEITNFVKEDLDKSKKYKENINREKEISKFVDYKDYLMSLDMKAIVKPFESKYYERVSQLSNKSNQFNLTTKRYTIENIKSIAENDEYITLYGKLLDKFGDNGIVSLAIGKINDDELDLELFLMSCRVLKRDMEYLMLDEIVNACKKRNINRIVARYLKTEKNAMVKNLLSDFGFDKLNENENGDSEWELKDLVNYKAKCKCIKVES